MRGVVYTAVFGRYDPLRELQQPKSPAFDYVVFTDSPDLKSESWRVVQAPRVFLDPARDSKRVKLLPHEYFPEHEVSIWHDARVDLRTSPEELVAAFLPDETAGFGSFGHPERQCIYEEAKCVVSWGIDSAEVVAPQIERYRARHFPENHGLINGSVLVRRHQRDDVRAAMDAWFHEVAIGSKRDQLSFNYVAWKLGFAHAVAPFNLNNNPYCVWNEAAPNRIPYGFDDRAYLEANPDVAEAKMDPRFHYVTWGYREGRQYRRSSLGS